METSEMHLGRLIDHVHLVVKDIEASRKFYKAIFKAMAIPLLQDEATYFAADELFVSGRGSEADLGELTGRHHLAFQAKDRAHVEKIHKAALEAGGKDNGKPGERKYHPGYYAAFMIDPDGNNIEAVYHGPAKRSAPSVKINW